MKLKELRQAVIDLGFDTEIEVDSAFYNAANRAVIEINDIQPKRKKYTITQDVLDNILLTTEDAFSIHTKGKSELVFHAVEPMAYYFECDGNGTAHIERAGDGAWEPVATITLESKRVFRAYRGLINSSGTVRIRFTGDFIYNIRNIAMYDTLYSAEEVDIPPFSRWLSYDLCERSDFMSMDDHVVKNRVRTLEKGSDYEIEGSIILLPISFRGELDIWYRAYPEKITTEQEEADADIDLPEELASLMPELVASYVWLDGENLAKAQRYYDLYKVRAADLIGKKRTLDGSFSYKTRGWA